MKMCTTKVRWPGHKQVFGTELSLIFLKGVIAKCGLLKGRRESVQDKWVSKRKPNIFRSVPGLSDKTMRKGYL
jgi:hypothetical protein